jgi:alkanesulfonate monooxygenase SsuD/methylene tetrahydromethanopterin reductase-like flavin-dependent oxidoreductase (luciferase family)
MEFHLYLPQVRLTYEQMVERALTAEAAGFEGLELMDHLTARFAPDSPVYDAMVTAGWLLARTSTLTVGHLVLCDSMRHPAVLAKEAVSLDHASGGRFELGLGWGSVPEELVAFGVGPGAAIPRVERLAESLEVITRLWRGEPVTYEGRHHQLTDARELPTPLATIPLVIGGSGARTMELVARYADWWNLPVIDLPRLEALRPRAGAARVSAQVFVTVVDDPARRAEIDETARRRFGSMLETYGFSGTPVELVEQIRALERRGVERLSTWFTDFAPPATLERFGAEVISAFEHEKRNEP